MNFLAIAPRTLNAVQKFFKNFPYRQVMMALSFTLNLFLASVILWPNILNILENHKTPSHPTLPITAIATVPNTPIVDSTSIALAIYKQATSGAPIISDSLSASDSIDWEVYSSGPTGECAFQNGAYHSIATPGNSNSCDDQSTSSNFSDLALQADVTIIQGNNAGIIFHSNAKEDSFYAFCITTDGRYLLYKSDPNSNTQDYRRGNSTAIKRGINQMNQLTVITWGNTFYFYVNDEYVGNASDNSYTSGQIGVFTNSDNTNLTEAAFTNLQLWEP